MGHSCLLDLWPCVRFWGVLDVSHEILVNSSVLTVFPLGRASKVGSLGVGFLRSFFCSHNEYLDKSTFCCSVSFVVDMVF